MSASEGTVRRTRANALAASATSTLKPNYSQSAPQSQERPVFGSNVLQWVTPDTTIKHRRGPLQSKEKKGNDTIRDEIRKDEKK